MASVIAHELAETVSDPRLISWCARVHARQVAVHGQDRALLRMVPVCAATECLSRVADKAVDEQTWDASGGHAG